MGLRLHFDVETVSRNPFLKKLEACEGGLSLLPPPKVQFPRSDPKVQKVRPRGPETSQKFGFRHLVPKVT